MGYEEKKLENGTVTRKAGIKIEELLFLENSFHSGDIVEGECQVVAEASEILGIRRKRRLTAAAQDGNVRDADLVLMIDVPGFHAETRAKEHHLTGIRGELRRFSVNGVDAKYKLQRIAGEDINTSFVLRQEVFAIRTETKVFDVAPQRVSQLLAREYPGEVLGVADTLVVEHRHLPLVKIVGREGSFPVNAARRQSVHVLQRFAQPF